MKFDRTEGKEPRYIVHLYGWNVADTFYYHDLKRAEKLFSNIKAKQKKGTILSLDSIENDMHICSKI